MIKKVMILIVLTLTLSSCGMIEESNSDRISELSLENDSIVKENTKLLLANEALLVKNTKLTNIYGALSDSGNNQFDVVEIDTSEEFVTTEGSTAEAHYLDGRLNHFTMVFYGELGKIEKRYYFIDDNTLYIEVVDWQYKEPLNTEDAVIVSEAFYLDGEVGYEVEENGLDFRVIEDRSIVEELQNDKITILNLVE